MKCVCEDTGLLFLCILRTSHLPDLKPLDFQLAQACAEFCKRGVERYSVNKYQVSVFRRIYVYLFF